MNENTTGGADSWGYLVDHTPDVAWVRELVERKRWTAAGEPAATGDPSEAAWRSARARMCQEIIAAVAEYNEAVGKAEILSTIAENGDITLSKSPYPTGFLEARFDRAVSRMHITARLRACESASEVTHVIAAGYVVRNDVVRFTWFGAETPPGEIVRRFLTPFFDEI